MEVIKKILELDIPDDAKTTMIKEFSDPNRKVKSIEKTPDKNVYIVNRDDIYYYYVLSKCVYFTPCADRETLDDLYGLFHIQKDNEVLKKIGTNLYFLSNTTPIRNGYFRIQDGNLVHTHYYTTSILKFTYLETKHTRKADTIATVYGSLTAGEWREYDLSPSSRDLVHPTYEKYGPLFGYNVITNILVAVFDKNTNINTLAITQTGPGYYSVTVDGVIFRSNISGTPCLISSEQVNKELAKLIEPNTIIEDAIHSGMRLAGDSVSYSHCVNQDHIVWSKFNDSALCQNLLYDVPSAKKLHGMAIYCDTVEYYAHGLKIKTIPNNTILSHLVSNSKLIPTAALQKYVELILDGKMTPYGGQMKKILHANDEFISIQDTGDNIIQVGLTNPPTPLATKKFKQVLLEAALPQFQEYIKKKLLKNAQYGSYNIQRSITSECLVWLVQYCKDNDLKYYENMGGYSIQWT